MAMGCCGAVSRHGGAVVLMAVGHVLEGEE